MINYFKPLRPAPHPFQDRIKNLREIPSLVTGGKK